MAKRLIVVLLNTDPRNPEELAAPFYHAAVAASMDYRVDLVCIRCLDCPDRAGDRETAP